MRLTEGDELMGRLEKWKIGRWDDVQVWLPLSHLSNRASGLLGLRPRSVIESYIDWPALPAYLEVLCNNRADSGSHKVVIRIRSWFFELLVSAFI